MHNGIKFTLVDRELTLPKLTAGPIKRAWPAIIRIQKAFASSNVDELLGDVIGDALIVIHAALERNHPDVTIEALEDLDGPAAIQLVLELVTLSGFAAAKTQPGEAPSP